MVDFLYMIFFVAIAHAMGKKILRACRFDFDSLMEEFVFSAGIGLAAFSFLVLILGSLGLLYRNVFTALFLILFALLFRDVRKNLQQAVRAIKAIRGVKFEFIDIFLGCLLAVALLITLVAAHAPAIGQDALVYHLADPKYFVDHHRVGNIPYSTNALWPYMMEMLFTLGLLFRGATLAKLFHFLTGALAAGAVYVFSRRLFQRRTALLAATVFCLVPGVFTQVAYAYIDIGLAYFTFLAYLAFFLWMYKNEDKWAALSGVFIGLAMGTKYLGVLSAFVLGIGLLFTATVKRVKEKRPALKPIALFGIFALGLASVWYIRSYIVWGNPVYPFYLKFVGENGWFRITARLGMGSGLINFLQLPWNMTMFPEAFGSGESQLGPIFLVLLPGILLIKRFDQTLKLLLFFLFSFFVIWFNLIQMLRFLAPYIPLMCVVFGYVYEGIDRDRGWLKRSATAAVVFALLLNFSLLVYYHKDRVKVAFDRKAREEYLSLRAREYEAARFVNTYLPRDSKLMLVNELRTFYFDRESVREALYRRANLYGRRCKSEDEVMDQLKREKFTHVLYRRIPRTTVTKSRPGPMSLAELLEKDSFKHRFLKKLFDYHYSWDRYHESFYELYEIL